MKAKLKKFLEICKSYFALIGGYLVGLAGIILGYIGILKLAAWFYGKLFKTDTFFTSLNKGDEQCYFYTDKEIPALDLIDIHEKLNNNEINFTEVINKLIENGYEITKLGVYNTTKD